MDAQSRATLSFPSHVFLERQRPYQLGRSECYFLSKLPMGSYSCTPWPFSFGEEDMASVLLL